MQILTRRSCGGRCGTVAGGGHRRGHGLLYAVPFVLLAAGPAWADGLPERVSVGPGGVQGNGHGFEPAFSADGRFVAFESLATNLVAGDTNAQLDVFVRDRKAGTTERVSVGLKGAQSDGGSASTNDAISANGRFVTFFSGASNLVPGDTNDAGDVFVRDRKTGTTRRVSVGSGGAQSNGESSDPAISADGRFVAFGSSATNLVPGDKNGKADIFVRDLKAGTTERVSVGLKGAQAKGESGSTGGPSISADGRFVAFGSSATNLVSGDKNGTPDIFVRDRKAGTTQRVSVGSGGTQGKGDSLAPSISADGRFVSFASDASNLVPGDSNASFDVFVRDRKAGTTRRVSVGPGGAQGDGISVSSAISGDGRFVVFQSNAPDLVPGGSNGQLQVFLRDLKAGTTEQLSVGPGGVQGDGQSFQPGMAANGRVAGFVSAAPNLVPNDSNGVDDVFAVTFR